MNNCKQNIALHQYSNIETSEALQGIKLRFEQDNSKRRKNSSSYRNCSGGEKRDGMENERTTNKNNYRPQNTKNNYENFTQMLQRLK